jgi:hypothetical protein
MRFLLWLKRFTIELLRFMFTLVVVLCFALICILFGLPYAGYVIGQDKWKQQGRRMTWNTLLFVIGAAVFILISAISFLIFELIG